MLRIRPKWARWAAGAACFFEGNKTFKAEDLHQSLRTHGDWLLAAQIIARLTTKQKKPEGGSSTQLQGLGMNGESNAGG